MGELILAAEIPNCECVSLARSSLMSAGALSPCQIKDLVLCGHWGIGRSELLVDLRSEGLDAPSGRIARREGFPGDEIADYLIVQVSNSRALEIVQYRDEHQYMFYDSGQRFMKLSRVSLPDDRSWIRRILFHKTRWVGDTISGLHGTVDLNYPLSAKSKVVLAVDAMDFPIYVATSLFHYESRFLIPPDSPGHPNSNVLAMHFLVSICIRLMIVRLEYC